MINGKMVSIAPIIKEILFNWEILIPLLKGEAFFRYMLSIAGGLVFYFMLFARSGREHIPPYLFYVLLNLFALLFNIGNWKAGYFFILLHFCLIYAFSLFVLIRHPREKTISEVLLDTKPLLFSVYCIILLFLCYPYPEEWLVIWVGGMVDTVTLFFLLARVERDFLAHDRGSSPLSPKELVALSILVLLPVSILLYVFS